MKIYIAHSKEFDYKNELYIPIRNSEKLRKHEIILPHAIDSNSSNTREFYKDIDIFIAEVSKPGIGLGIELGWAFDENKPIYCIYKSGFNVSRSVYTITKNVYKYKDTSEMLKIIKDIVNR